MNAAVARRGLPVPKFPDHGDEGAALCSVSFAAREFARGHVLLDSDEQRLEWATAYLESACAWELHADAVVLNALRRARAAGRRMEASDVDQLRRISARMHARLAQLDAITSIETVAA